MELTTKNRIKFEGIFNSKIIIQEIKQTLFPEEWKDIEEYSGRYRISNHGRVRSVDYYIRNGNESKALRKGVLLKPKIGRRFYYVTLSKDNKRKKFGINRLVAKYFLEGSGKYVMHIDRNKKNNIVTNLFWK